MIRSTFSRPVSTVLAGALVLMIAGPLAAQTATSRHAATPHVILVRGIVGYWPGIENLKARLHRQGCHTTAYAPIEARAAADNIVLARRQGRIGGSLRIIAYSAGGAAAIELARSLGQRGVWVDRLVLIEATNPGTIPPNVRYVYNLYESRPQTDWMPLFRGQSVRTESRNTRVVNYDVRGRDFLSDANHFTMATQHRAQAIAAYQAVGRRRQSVTRGLPQPAVAQQQTPTAR